MTDFRISLPDAVLEEVARRAAELVVELLGEQRAPSPYFTVPEAADYLRADRQRVYDLLSSGRLARHKDGTRVLVSRAEVDAYLAQGNGRRVAHALPTVPRGRMGRRVAT